MAEYVFNMDTIKSCYSETKENCPFCFIAIKNGERHCSLSSCKCLTSKRPNDCPLIEVPIHGDLKDWEKIKEIFSKYLPNVEDKTNALLCEIMTDIGMNAPTVLEAST